MGRWLSKTERGKRDAIILRLYNEGCPISQIAAQFGRCRGWVNERLEVLEAKPKGKSEQQTA